MHLGIFVRKWNGISAALIIKMEKLGEYPQRRL